ncbi:MAG TPA: hypothetical protein VHN80_12835 [Kineosporiaceae bacterium]|nr:hypothetical protein [Kineosporiaceae bacterium]
MARKRSRTPNRQATRRPDAGQRTPPTSPAMGVADPPGASQPAQIEPAQIEPEQVQVEQIGPAEIDPEQIDPEHSEPGQIQDGQVQDEQVDSPQATDAAPLDSDALLAALVEHAIAAVSAAAGPLDAEWVLCRLLAMIEVDAPAGVTDRQRAQLRAGLLADLIDGAERQASADALALLRVCEVYGPEATRLKARGAAARLSASGIAEPAWAGYIGRPRSAGIWWYGDAAGRQESVGLIFTYPGEPHVISVLVDHDLGGGIRDCWSADGPEAAGLRERTAEVIAAEPGATFRDIDAEAALDVLASAIELPGCAPEPQVEDVAICVELLRSRIEVLAATADS